MRRSAFQWKQGLFCEKGGGNSVNGGLVRISTGKAIQWRGSGDSVNRRTLKTQKLLSSSPSRKSALIPMLLTGGFWTPIAGEPRETLFWHFRGFECQIGAIIQRQGCRGEVTMGKIQKKRDVHKISPRNSGAGNGCADFMGACHFFVLSAGKPPRP